MTHASNMAWLARHGLHCATSTVRADGYRPIGRSEIIELRSHREVPVGPKGRLCDYVPFYFTSRTPMLYNIKTGYAGLRKCPMSELVILVSSLPRLLLRGLDFVFTDRHACLATARFYRELTDLENIWWDVIASGDFKRTPDQPDRFERYQAEALVHRHVPFHALSGVACYDTQVEEACVKILGESNCHVPVAVRPDWFL